MKASRVRRLGVTAVYCLLTGQFPCRMLKERRKDDSNLCPVSFLVWFCKDQ